MDIPRNASLGTVYLLNLIDKLTRLVDGLRAEKDAGMLALAATEAYAKRQEAEVRRLLTERDELAAQVRARLVEVHTLNARLLIANGGQI
jgi:hypothetical protein